MIMTNARKDTFVLLPLKNNKWEDDENLMLILTFAHNTFFVRVNLNVPFNMTNCCCIISESDVGNFSRRTAYARKKIRDVFCIILSSFVRALCIYPLNLSSLHMLGKSRDN